MTRLVAWLLVALVVASALTTVAPANGRAVPQMGGDGNGSAPPGGFVSSVVGMEEAEVDATVTIARFETRLAAAETDGERAAVLGTTLAATNETVSMLEMRLATLQAKRMNGSISEGWFAVETSWLLASAENQGRVVARLERAARSLPASELASHDASHERIEALQSRVATLRETERPAIHETAFDRRFYEALAGFAARFNESAGAGGSAGSGTVARLLDGERVTFVVEPAMGTPSVVSFRTTDDARIVDLRAGAHADATVRLRTDAATARRLFTAENPRRAFATALLEGDISVRGVGPTNRVKWGVRSAVLEAVRAVASVGGAVASADGAVASVGGAVASADGAVASVGGAIASADGVVASVGGAVASADGGVASVSEVNAVVS